MKSWFYKWLPIIFGCHCRDDRSFHWNGEKFPICARCTGELLGILLSSLAAPFWMPGGWLAAVLLIPMVTDGCIQLWTHYESTNFRRLITGGLFGYGFWTLFLQSSIFVFRMGYQLTN